MADRFIGGSSNVIIDGSSTDTFVLTGLDANGKVLTALNVKVVAGLSPKADIGIVLPEISSINGRAVQYNINSNNYAGDIYLNSADGNFINGVAQVIIATDTNVVNVVSSGSSNGWVVPTLNIPTV
jgi:hypothetical protein